MKSLHDVFEFKEFDHSSFENLVAERISRAGAGYAAMFCALFGLGYWFTGPRLFVPGNLIAAALMGWVAYRQPISAAFSIFLTVNLALVLLGQQLVLLGGINYAPAIWLVVPCVAVLLAGQRRLGVYSMAASGVLILGVMVARKTGLIVARTQLPDNEVIMGVSVFAAQVLTVALGLIILRARDRLIIEIRDRTRALSTALLQAQTARDEAEASREEALRASAEADQARNEALAASRSKEQFFANLTHEIRTPLAGILGAAELLERGQPRDDQKAVVGALANSAQVLGDVVEAMLDHAKLSVGHVNADVAAVSVRDLMASVSDLVAPRAQEKRLGFQVRIAPQVPDRVLTDPGWVSRILVNLLANAIKFTEAGDVRLSVDVEPATPSDGDPVHGARMLRLSVSDTGIGIAADKREAVFAPFVQADASISRRYGGTGLGLTISRRLAELLGGSIELISEAGQGATFIVRLPLNEPRSATPFEPPITDSTSMAAGADRLLPAGLPMRRVLLVDDNALNRLLALEMLKLLGCEVTVAENGAQAIEQARQRAFDCVLMDLQMPDLDGIAATRAIRHTELALGRTATPIIALTGNSASDYGQACVEAGMTGFLTKPVGLERLAQLLHDLPSDVPCQAD